MITRSQKTNKSKLVNDTYPIKNSKRHPKSNNSIKRVKKSSNDILELGKRRKNNKIQTNSYTVAFALPFVTFIL